MSKDLLARLFFVFSWVVFIGSCVTAGEDVIRITSLHGTDSSVLKPQEREQIEELKRTTTGSNINPALSAEIEKTPHYGVEEYLATRPDAGGSAPGQDYKVGGYDVLNILVYEEKDLTRQAVRVSADGHISFPLVGRLKVDGLTPSEIETLISRKLAEQQYLHDAHVSVMVTEYRSKQYLVLGAVHTPGGHPLQAKERVLDALSKAGGLATEKVGKRAMVIRAEKPNTSQEQKIVINIDLQGLLKGKDQVSNIALMDKDVLFIPAAEYFFIMGQVKSPGSYAIPEKEITLVEAISLAGGFTPIASRNRTRILRVEEGVEKIIQVKVDAITKQGMKIKDVVIQPNDVIIVPESFF